MEQDYAFAILRPLQEEAATRGFEVRWMVLPPASPALLHDNEVLVGSAAAAVDWQPDMVFVPGDRVPGFLPGLKAQVFHGLNDDKRGDPCPERGLFDLYCTEGPQRTGDLTAAPGYNQSFKVVETGWVKLDSLLNPAVQSAAKYDRKQILFASTFTPRLSGAAELLPEIERLAQTGEWQWLITLHPKMDPEIDAAYRALEGPHLRYFGTEHVIDLLHRADVMVSDNSSILQEYMLLQKPLITFRNRDPHPAMRDITRVEALEPAIRQALQPDPARESAMAGYGSAITPWLDGKSAGRILDAAAEMLTAGWVDRKPLNLLRNFRMRRQHNYFKFW